MSTGLREKRAFRERVLRRSQAFGVGDRVQITGAINVGGGPGSYATIVAIKDEPAWSPGNWWPQRRYWIKPDDVPVRRVRAGGWQIRKAEEET